MGINGTEAEERRRRGRVHSLPFHFWERGGLMIYGARSIAFSAPRIFLAKKKEKEEKGYCEK